MMYKSLFIAASASVASAQITYNNTTNTYVCPANAPNGAFCAGDSLGTNIIIRCTNGVAQPANCNANLSGYPPLGGVAECFQTSPTAGDANCVKNCFIPAISSTLAGCTPIYTATSTASPSSSGSVTITTTGVTTQVSQGTTITKTFTTTYCPESSSTLSTSVYVNPSLSSTGTAPPPPPAASSTIPPPPSGNGTLSTTSKTPGGSATATPVGPTTTQSGGGPAQVTSGANILNNGVAGGAIAGLGLVVAYFL